jgi:DNA replication ATP-dependent helicase Dna2
MGLFASPGTGSRLRELVVDLAPPEFDAIGSLQLIKGLNEDQMLAIATVASARDYVLLLGMPGTGKTTTLAALIKWAVDSGQTVLIASYTHTAVDNLCLKLVDTGVGFIRIGRSESMHEDIQPYSLEAILGRAQSVSDVAGAIEECRVFSLTCLGFQHQLICSRQFDICVVDEASQINVPTVLGPLSRCKRFILVGDHYQLPPIKKYGSEMNEHSESLFRALCESHPHALVTLRTQYRMNNDIMRICNELVYGFRMRTGLSSVGNRRMYLSRLDAVREFDQYHKDWIMAALLPDPPVLVYDTDSVPMRERRGHGSKVNYGEAAIVSAIAVAMVIGGMPPHEIGIISPYRAQGIYVREAVLKQLQCVTKYYPHLVPDAKAIADAIECQTVDKFQGRDKECVIFSSVKSNVNCSPGNHITDWQRLNVAVTRAKSKFILLGSVTTIRRAPFFDRMLDIIGLTNIVPLPREIDEACAKPFVAMAQLVAPVGSEDTSLA